MHITMYKVEDDVKEISTLYNVTDIALDKSLTSYVVEMTGNKTALIPIHHSRMIMVFADGEKED